MTQPNIFEKVIDALNRCGCRYVVVGGLAVNLHGYQRFTSDIDVEIDLSPRASQLAIQAIFDLGFSPRVPILPEDFLDLEKRNDWIVNKQAKVISFLHPEHQTFSVDIFIDPPIDFTELYTASTKEFPKMWEERSSMSAPSSQFGGTRRSLRRRRGETTYTPKYKGRVAFQSKNISLLDTL